MYSITNHNRYRMMDELDLAGREPTCRPLHVAANFVGTTAAIVGGVIAAGGAIGGAALSSGAAKKASKTQAEAADRATELQREMYYNNIDLQKPWHQAGQAGLNQLMALSGFESYTPDDPHAAEREKYQANIDAYNKVADNASSGPGLIGSFAKSFPQMLAKAYQQKAASLPAVPATSWRPAGDGASTAAEILQMDPSYQFRFAEGQKALDRSAAAKGGALSGGAIKASARYGQDMASTEYGNIWNRLAAIAGIGQTATGQMNTLGANYATQAGDMMTQAANARASGYVGSSNAWGNAVGSIGTNLADLYAMSRTNAPAVPAAGNFITAGIANVPPLQAQPLNKLWPA